MLPAYCLHGTGMRNYFDLYNLELLGYVFLPISQSTGHGCCFSLVTLQVTTTLLVANPLLKMITSFQWYSQGRPGRAHAWLILTCQLLCAVTAHSSMDVKTEEEFV